MIWHVNPSTGNNSNDGRTPKTAFKSLTHAVEAAKPGDTIWLTPGAYDEDLPAQVSAARSANIIVSVIGSE